MNKKQLVYTILVGLFIIISLMMNVTAVISIPLFNVEFLNITRLNGTPLTNMEITWALPLAAVMMVLVDILAEVYSKKETLIAVGLGYLGGFMLSMWLLIGFAIAGDYAGNNFSLIIDGELVAHFFPWDALGQSWRFLLSGFLAYIASAGVSVFIIWALKARHKEKKMFNRMALSTIAGQITDNIIFLTLAFMPLGISFLERSWPELLLLFGITTVLEIIIELIFTPIAVKLSKDFKQEFAILDSL